MAFWNKGEDPWDIDPARERVRREREPMENPLDTLRAWNEKRKADAAAKEAELASEPPEKCPWCGADMERGYLSSAKGIFWTPGRMTARAAWIGPPREIQKRQLRVDNEGAVFTCKTAWYCASCKKMTIDAAGLEAPVNYWSDSAEERESEENGGGKLPGEKGP